MVKIKERRKVLNIKAQELLDNGIPLLHPQYSLIESGKVLPTPNVLIALCRALDCSPLDLYDSLSDIDLAAIQFKPKNSKSKVSRFDTLPPANPKVQIRLPRETIEELESDLHILGYSCFGQYVRKNVVPEIRKQASNKVEKIG